MKELTDWTEFIGTQLAIAEVDEKDAVSHVEKAKAISAVTNAGEKTVTAAKSKAFEDPAFLALTEEASRAYAYRKMVEVLYNNTERKSFLLSRELTRRVGREPRENRRDRMTT